MSKGTYPKLSLHLALAVCKYGNCLNWMKSSL